MNTRETPDRAETLAAVQALADDPGFPVCDDDSRGCTAPGCMFIRRLRAILTAQEGERGGAMDAPCCKGQTAAHRCAGLCGGTLIPHPLTWCDRCDPYHENPSPTDDAIRAALDEVERRIGERLGSPTPINDAQAIVREVRDGSGRS